jgi:hypothetical protein
LHATQVRFHVVAVFHSRSLLVPFSFPSILALRSTDCHPRFRDIMPCSHFVPFSFPFCSLIFSARRSIARHPSLTCSPSIPFSFAHFSPRMSIARHPSFRVVYSRSPHVPLSLPHFFSCEECVFARHPVVFPCSSLPFPFRSLVTQLSLSGVLHAIQASVLWCHVPLPFPSRSLISHLCLSLSCCCF